MIRLSLDSQQRVVVLVKCVAGREVPRLKIDDDGLGAVQARLENVTATEANPNCAAFDITISKVTGDSVTGKDSLLSIELPVVEGTENNVDGYVRTRPSAFVFNPVTGNWSKARGGGKPSEPNKVIATLTKKSNKVIAGVLAFPDILSQDPTALTPKALLAATEDLDPTAGVLRIKPPQANSMGGTSTTLPLMLRDARGPTPEVSINYSSSNGVGWLGKGWDLSVPTIEVATSSPEFALEVESEDYSFQGVALIPVKTTDTNGAESESCNGYLTENKKPYATLARGGEIVSRYSRDAEDSVAFEPPICVTEYRRRENSGNIKFWRIGAGPHDYVWKTYDPNTGELRLFGGRPVKTAIELKQHPTVGYILSDNAIDKGGVISCTLGSSSKGDFCVKERGISRWYLSQTIDQQKAANSAEYSYSRADQCDDSLPQDGCAQRARLNTIEYSTSLHPPEELTLSSCASLITGQTQIRFDWTERNPKWISTNARGGQLLSQEYWLSNVVVSYKDYEPKKLPGAALLAEKLGSEKCSNDFLKGKSKPTARIYSQYNFNYGDPRATLNFQKHLESIDILTEYPEENKPSSLHVAYQPSGWPNVGNEMVSQTFEFDYYSAATDDITWSVNQSVEIKGDERLALKKAKSRAKTLTNILPGSFDQLAAASPLGTSGSEEVGGSLYVGFGADTNVTSKTNSVGLKLGHTYSDSVGSTVLSDLSGDGISDQLLEISGEIDLGSGAKAKRFVICLGEPDESEYPKEPKNRFDVLSKVEWNKEEIRKFKISDDCLPVKNLGSSFSLSDSKTQSAGAEVYPPNGMFIGIGSSDSSNATKAYFDDLDSDGLSDVAANGVVYYNHGILPCDKNDPEGSRCLTFEQWSPLLPVLPANLEALSAQADEAFEYISDELDQIENRLIDQLNSLTQTKEYDQVVLWQAPKKGFVTGDLFGNGGQVTLAERRGRDVVTKNLKQLILERAGVKPRVVSRGCEENLAYEKRRADVLPEGKYNAEKLQELDCEEKVLGSFISRGSYELRNRLQSANMVDNPSQQLEVLLPVQGDSCTETLSDGNERGLRDKTEQELEEYTQESAKNTEFVELWKQCRSSLLETNKPLKSQFESGDDIVADITHAKSGVVNGVNSGGIERDQYRGACKVHLRDYSSKKEGAKLTERSIEYLCGDQKIPARVEVFIDRNSESPTGSAPEFLFSRNISNGGVLEDLVEDWGGDNRTKICKFVEPAIPDVTKDSHYHPFLEEPFDQNSDSCGEYAIEVEEGDVFQVVVNDSPQFQPIASTSFSFQYVLEVGEYSKNRKLYDAYIKDGSVVPVSQFIAEKWPEAVTDYNSNFPSSTANIETISLSKDALLNVAFVADISADYSDILLTVYSTDDEQLQEYNSHEIDFDDFDVVAELEFSPKNTNEALDYIWNESECVHSDKNEEYQPRNSICKVSAISENVDKLFATVWSKDGDYLSTVEWLSPPRVEYRLRPGSVAMPSENKKSFIVPGRADDVVQIAFLPIYDPNRSIATVRPTHTTKNSGDSVFSDSEFTRQYSRIESELISTQVVCSNIRSHLEKQQENDGYISVAQLDSYCKEIVSQQDSYLNEQLLVPDQFDRCADLIKAQLDSAVLPHQFLETNYCVDKATLQSPLSDAGIEELLRLASLISLPLQKVEFEKIGDKDILSAHVSNLDKFLFAKAIVSNGEFELPELVKVDGCLQEDQEIGDVTCNYSIRLDLRKNIDDEENSLKKLLGSALSVSGRNSDYVLTDYKLSLSLIDAFGEPIQDLLTNSFEYVVTNSSELKDENEQDIEPLPDSISDIQPFSFRAQPGEKVTLRISVDQWKTERDVGTHVVDFDSDHLNVALSEGHLFDLAEVYLVNEDVDFLFVNRTQSGGEIEGKTDVDSIHQIPIQLPVSYRLSNTKFDTNSGGWGTYALLDNSEEGVLPEIPTLEWSISEIEKYNPRPGVGDALCGIGAETRIKSLGEKGETLAGKLNGIKTKDDLNSESEDLVEDIKNFGCEGEGAPLIAFYRYRWLGPSAYNPYPRLERSRSENKFLKNQFSVTWQEHAKLTDDQRPLEKNTSDVIVAKEDVVTVQSSVGQPVQEQVPVSKSPSGLCHTHPVVSNVQVPGRDSVSSVMTASWLGCHVALDSDIAIRSVQIKENDPQDRKIYSESDRIGPDEAALATLFAQAETLETLNLLADKLLDRTSSPTVECGKESDYTVLAQSGRPKPCWQSAATDEQGNAPRQFAPIQRSETGSLAVNVSGSGLSASMTAADRTTVVNFLDINGDGFKEIISEQGSTSPTSPVGISRTAWFKSHKHPRTVAEVKGFKKHANSLSFTLGATATSPTAGMYLARGVSTLTSGAIEGNYSPSVGANIGYGFDTDFSDFADFNGDGLVDVYTGKTLDDELKANFNFGKGVMAEVPMMSPSGQSSSATGRPNAFKPGSNGLTGESHFGVNNSGGITLNLGASFDNNSLTFGLGTGLRISSQEVAFLDFTGDGLSDLVIPVSSDGCKGFVVLPNLGNGFDWKHWRHHCVSGLLYSENGASEATFVDMGGNYTNGVAAYGLKFIFTVGLKQTENHNRTLLQIQDFNADGVPDIAQVKGAYQGTHDKSGALWLPTFGKPTPDSSPTVFYNPEARTGLLRAVTNPTQDKIEIAYELKGNTSARHGQKVWALAGTRTFDGYEPDEQSDGGDLLPRDGHDISLALYEYRDGHYQRAEKAFYGFDHHKATHFGCDLNRSIEVETAGGGNPISKKGCSENSLYEPLRTSISKFDNEGYFSKGSVQQSALIDQVSNRLLSLSEQTYSIQDHRSLHVGGPIYNDRLTADSWESARYDDTTQIPLAPETTSKNLKQTACGGLPEESALNECIDDNRKGIWRAAMREYLHPFAVFPGAQRARVELNSVYGEGVPFKSAFQSPTPEEAKGAWQYGHEKTALVRESGEKPVLSSLLIEPDIWGQTRTFMDLGVVAPAHNDADRPTPDPVLNAAESSKTTSRIQYEVIDIGNKPDSGNTHPALPLLNRPLEIKVADKNKDLRIRQGLYEMPTGNVTDLCVIDPGTSGDILSKAKKLEEHKNACAAFVTGVASAMSLEQDGLPAKSAVAKVLSPQSHNIPIENIIHQQIAAYDDFGNPLRTVSPLNTDGEWVERHFSYVKDPFRKTPTTTAISRCLLKSKDGWKGKSSTIQRHGCLYLSDSKDSSIAGSGAGDLPGSIPPSTTQVSHEEIIHQSTAIIDRHHGGPAVTTDTNGHSLLLERDQWQRPTLIARNFGGETPANFNKQVQGRLVKASKRFAVNAPGRWNPVLDIDYNSSETKKSNTDRTNKVFNAHIRRFVSSRAYRGLRGNQLPDGAIHSMVIADGQGKKLQEIRHSEICIESTGVDAANDEVLCEEENYRSLVVQPMPAVDAIGRQVETFEAYEAQNEDGTDLTVKNVAGPIPNRAANAAQKLWPLNTTWYDAADKPLLQLSRLGWLANEKKRTGNERIVRGDLQDAELLFFESTQNGYRTGEVFVDTDFGYPSFEVLTLSPRCSAVRSVFDARGLTVAVTENQTEFFNNGKISEPILPSVVKGRAYDLDKCLSVQQAAEQWPDGGAGFTGDSGDSRVNQSLVYRYDPLRYLRHVELPSVKHPELGTAESLGTIEVTYDGFGRRTGIDDVNMGHREFVYDNMSNVIEETAKPLGSEIVETTKQYTYDADRLIGIDYTSGSEYPVDLAADQADSVQFVYDDHIDVSALVSDEATSAALQQVLDRTGCENCFGRVAMVKDRSGVRWSSFNPLGQEKFTLRSMFSADSGVADQPVKEIGRFGISSEFTSFGDLVSVTLDDRVPMHPHPNCLKQQPSGLKYLCGGEHRLSYRYTPDGKTVGVNFGQDAQPIMETAFDALARPFTKRTGDGSRSLYSFDLVDLRLNTGIAKTAKGDEKRLGKTVHNNEYLYEVGGNIRDYKNALEGYNAQFSFGYDPANRLRSMRSKVHEKDYTAAYAYDEAHRFAERYLTDGSSAHHWRYRYPSSNNKPQHAPEEIFYSNDKVLAAVDNALKEDVWNATGVAGRYQAADIKNFGAEPNEGDAAVQTTFDALGRLEQTTRADGIGTGGKYFEFSDPKVPTNRRITWDAEDRIRRIISNKDSQHINDHYIYDFGNNRSVKRVNDENGVQTTVLYVAPFYSRGTSKRGTVQVSANNLPVASIATPAGDTNDAPLITYLFADLATGSVNASVTTPGLPGFSDPLIARQEYSPYGVGLASGSVDDNRKNIELGVYSFHGKELDVSTGFSIFGARSYSSGLGIWVSADPILHRYLNQDRSGDFQTPGLLTSYSFTLNNPVNHRDPDGNVVPLLVHAGRTCAMSAPCAARVTSALAGLARGLGRTAPIPIVPLSEGIQQNETFNENKTKEIEETQATPKPTPHADERKQQADSGDRTRQVGDRNKVIKSGRKFKDTKTGNIVNVLGDKVVITSKNGKKIISQFRNSRRNTQKRIEKGRWKPMKGE